MTYKAGFINANFFFAMDDTPKPVKLHYAVIQLEADAFHWHQSYMSMQGITIANLSWIENLARCLCLELCKMFILLPNYKKSQMHFKFCTITRSFNVWHYSYSVCVSYVKTFSVAYAISQMHRLQHQPRILLVSQGLYQASKYMLSVLRVSVFCAQRS